MRYEKGSFITVPSRDKLRGLHPTAQAMYMWLCAYSNETGDCFPSRTRLAKDCGCSEKMIDKMLDLLLKTGLVKSERRVEANKNLTNLYTVIVWSGAQDTPGGAYSSPGVGHDVRKELKPVLTQPTKSFSSVPLEEIKITTDEEKATKISKAKYPNAKIAFDWLPNRQTSWDNNTTQLIDGELLFKRGETAVRSLVRFVQRHEDDDGWNYVFTKPSDYERKWEDMKTYAKRNS